MPFPRRRKRPVTVLIVPVATPAAAMRGQTTPIRVAGQALGNPDLSAEFFRCREITGESIGDLGCNRCPQAEIQAHGTSTARRVVEWHEVHSPAPRSRGVAAISARRTSVVDVGKYPA
jgi:hypothetical protein